MNFKKPLFEEVHHSPMGLSCPAKCLLYQALRLSCCLVHRVESETRFTELHGLGYSEAMNYKSLIRDVPDFPIPGVLFRDVSPLLQNAEAFSQVSQDFATLIDLKNVDLFVGVESRGFIFAAQMAAKFSKGFLPLRKAGKLPPPVHQESYELEYGKATLEMAPASKKMRVVVCDDVLATGGTLKASINLCEKAGYQVEDVLVLINLTFLNQMKFKNQPIKSLVQY